MSSVEIHYTHKIKVNDPYEKGWEFSCPHCGYRSRYVLKNGSRTYELIVIEKGDSCVRHTNNFTDDYMSADYFNDESFQPEMESDYQEGEIWLPYHLQQQIEEIIDRFDLGS